MLLLTLAFETSAKAGSVALLEGRKLLGESYQNTGLTHSQTIMTMAQDLIAACGYTPQQVEAVAMAAGPGSFTGIRIGVAAAKGFAWGAQIPCYGVSTLEAMALNLGAYDGLVVGTMDARRSQVYTATFRAEKGVLTRLTEDRAISLQQLEEELAESTLPVYLVGDGSILTFNTLSGVVPQLVMPVEHKMHQRAAGVGLAAAAMIEAGLPGNGAELQPNYLRLSQAERERMEKEQK